MLAVWVRSQNSGCDKTLKPNIAALSRLSIVHCRFIHLKLNQHFKDKTSKASEFVMVFQLPRINEKFKIVWAQHVIGHW